MPEPRTFKVALPVLPPTTNNLYKTVFIKNLGFSKRAPTGAYEVFLEGTVPYLRRKLPSDIREPVAVDIIVWGGRGWRENSDLSNRLKAVEDALVKAERISDDNCTVVKDGRRRYYDREEHCRARGIKPTTTAQRNIDHVFVLQVRELDP